jgi:hypothetical protein
MQFPPAGKGILAVVYNPAAPGVAPRFRPPVLSLFRSEIAQKFPVPGV